MAGWAHGDKGRQFVMSARQARPSQHGRRGRATRGLPCHGPASVIARSSAKLIATNSLDIRLLAEDNSSFFARRCCMTPQEAVPRLVFRRHLALHPGGHQRSSSRSGRRGQGSASRGGVVKLSGAMHQRETPAAARPTSADWVSEPPRACERGRRRVDRQSRLWLRHRKARHRRPGVCPSLTRAF